MSEPQTIRPSIFLDYGADAADATDTPCEICERGMRFSSQWQFHIGAVLHIAFAFEDGGPCRVEAEGLVIECLSCGSREYLTTLVFVEPPKDLRDRLGKISTRLAFRPRDPGSI
ncbi:MAG: hypothetical protein NTZ46_00150 [Verrucomicrobia bacterium]|nr:hypothetical protein [Verrucomicrobiota bacterium]